MPRTRRRPPTHERVARAVQAHDRHVRRLGAVSRFGPRVRRVDGRLVHSVVGLRIGLGAVFVGVVVWVTQLRPRVTAYPATLQLRGILRDTRVPYVLIDEVTMGQTLNVWVGAIATSASGSAGRSAPTSVSARCGRAARAPSGTHELATAGGAGTADARSATTASCVTRIADLVAAGATAPRPRPACPRCAHSYAVPRAGGSCRGHALPRAFVVRRSRPDAGSRRRPDRAPTRSARRHLAADRPRGEVLADRVEPLPATIRAASTPSGSERPPGRRPRGST